MIAIFPDSDSARPAQSLVSRARWGVAAGRLDLRMGRYWERQRSEQGDGSPAQILQANAGVQVKVSGRDPTVGLLCQFCG